MKVYNAVLVLGVLLIFTNCDDEYVGKSKYDALQKQLAATQEELQKVREELVQWPLHNYQLINRGSRSFRFDAVDGSTCLLLASKADWKDRDTSMSLPFKLTHYRSRQSIDTAIGTLDMQLPRL